MLYFLPINSAASRRSATTNTVSTWIKAVIKEAHGTMDILSTGSWKTPTVFSTVYYIECNWASGGSRKCRPTGMMGVCRSSDVPEPAGSAASGYGIHRDAADDTSATTAAWAVQRTYVHQSADERASLSQQIPCLPNSAFTREFRKYREGESR